MTRYVALLRAVNVGGTGKLAMADLRSICTRLGFENVETYIASGNVVFDSRADATSVKTKLQARLQDHTGKSIGVVVRTATDLAAILEANPFPNAEPSRTYVVFLDGPPPRDTIETVAGRVDEELHLGKREIYIRYPGGMGRSKLAVPAAKRGTARNMNTVKALAELACRPA